MATKNAPPLFENSERLDEIRDIILGPQLRALEQKVEKLTRQVEAESKRQINLENYDRRLKRLRESMNRKMERVIRRSAAHKAKTTIKVNELASELRRVTKRLRVDRKRRAALGEAMATLADQFRISASRRPSRKAGRPASRAANRKTHPARTSNGETRHPRTTAETSS